MKAPRFLLGLGLLGLATLTVGKPIVRAGAAGVRDSPATPQAEPPGRPTQIPGNVLAPTAVAIVRFSDVAAQDDARRRTLEQLRTRQLGQRMPPEGEHDEPTAPGLQSLTIGARDSIPAAGVPSPAPTLSYEGLDDISDGSFFYIPPDTTGAVGPTHVFNTLNNNYRILTKSTGATVSTVSQNSFWRPVNPADGVFDPQALYDPYQNRFIVAAVASAQSTSSSLLVGVSNSSDPGGTWTLARYPMGSINCTGSVNCWADYPTLGFNQTWMAVGVNMFTVSNNAFVESRVTAFDYSIFLSGTAPALDYFVTSDFTVHPVVTYSNTQTTLYLPTHYSSNSAAYRLNTITGTASTPVYTQGALKAHSLLSGWASPGGDILPQASEPGTGLLQDIDAGDARIINAVFRNNAIWYTQTIALPAHGPISRTAAQWVKLDVLGNDVDAGRVQDATATPTNGGKWYAFPSIAVNANNDVLLGYSQFSSAQFASAGYSFRFSGDAAGTMRDPTISKNGIGFYYKTFSGDANRWGDFSQTTVDPSDDISLWTVQEFSNAQNGTGNGSGKWSTWWTQITPASTYSLTINKIGSGSGAVTSSPAGIDCGATCSASFSSGQVVTLTATPAAGSLFGGWTGDADCSDGSVTMTAARNCTATFTQSYSLTINKTGSGSGTVTSNPAGISCGATCSTSFASGQVVALTATPAAGSIFDGWSGDADCTDGSVTMTAARSCTATFTQTFALAITKVGSGSGTVTSNPAGINCGATCNASFSSGQVVVLTATPAAGSIFDGWSGDADCSDGSVTMSGARNCTATFTQIYTLAITKVGSGNGTVMSSPAGINCGATCSASFSSGQVVALTPTPAAGSIFDGWSGDADCSDGNVTMSSARSCTATFTQTYTLAMTKAGSGSGTVTSNPAGINCGATCSASFSSGQVVALTPTPAAGSIFDGWSGDADCSDGSVTMSAARSCTATFTQTYTLTINKTGSGTGTVTTSPAGINCGATCSASFSSGQVVALTPAPAAGSIFDGWTGEADCSDGSVTMSAARSCTATFTQTYTLTINKTGSGTGTVTSSPAGINCGATCSASFSSGQVVALTPTPAAGSIFDGWSGDVDCSDGSVTMSSGRTCTATFTQTYTLSISKAGSGTGTVTSSPAGINCGAACNASFSSGQVVALTATPAAGSIFDGWSGDADCTDGSVTMSAARSCTATFTQTYTLTINKTGSGTGTVTSSPAGINCGATCGASFVSGQVVALTPTPASGSLFGGWSGDADCSDGSVTMSAAQSCTAMFTQTYALAITKAGNGSGTVTSNPVGINCGATCGGSFSSGQVVALTATPAAGSIFDGWSGDADCTDASVTMSAARNCIATFSLIAPGTFGKTSPVNDVVGQPTNLNLSWQSANAAISYQYCYDTTNNGTCDTAWTGVGAATNAAIIGLATNRVYYWQARAVNNAATTEANGGMWWAFTTDAGGPRVANDFNGDGHADLVWRNYATGTNIVWQMNDTQILGAAAQLPDVSDPNWKLLVVADLDGDKRTDLLWRHVVTGDNLVWRMSGTSVTGGASLTTVSDPNWTIFGAADADGNGQVDLFWRNTLTGDQAIWYLVNGAVASTGGLPAISDRNWQPAAAIDMDGDGIVDIVQRNDATGENRITTLQGAVKASIPPVSDVNWVIAAVIDLDGDQRPDLVWRNTATGQDVVWHMNGGAIKNSASLTSVTDMNWRMPGQLRRREPTDFNSDGAPDFVWRHAVTGDNVLWHMDGTSVLNVMSMPGVYDTNWKIAAIADFNHDRNPDLVWRNTVTGDDVLWLMRDATVLQTMPLTSVANLSWDLVGAGDLNHDGNPDLLWRNTTTGENVVWFMNGPVIQQTAPLTTVADTNWKLVATADLNRDQYADLIWRNSATGANLVWCMNGNSLVASAPLPTVADTTWTLAIATDVNGDGAPDLVWRNTTSGLNVVWYMNGTTVLLTVSLSEVTDTQWKLVK